MEDGRGGLAECVHHDGHVFVVDAVIVDGQLEVFFKPVVGLVSLGGGHLPREALLDVPLEAG